MTFYPPGALQVPHSNDREYNRPGKPLLHRLWNEERTLGMHAKQSSIEPSDSGNAKEVHIAVASITSFNTLAAVYALCRPVWRGNRYSPTITLPPLEFIALAGTEGSRFHRIHV